MVQIFAELEKIPSISVYIIDGTLSEFKILLNIDIIHTIINIHKNHIHLR